ncbi:uncharacterized protein PGTG_01736 [Puccinia graminis f. sp. tritici CRL 75-36-700-3]|uniref:Uncharacterized protein n=1 Tax=Puccinia graminis f. sp. tritici (strain CRL 75-36-700-3 / race SCCL) TaxID=418459 RepID=E3JSW8_PUCGT|nr:uncharacterized protein PGTG_01736 [Puccinia graminis f. sp. tritici CRL 75-36-700-3]EFP75143.1 hypothetical protein PGTG_01736 [Puccinia graminis f. sp. tritici CRL 75-36-700-3]
MNDSEPGLFVEFWENFTWKKYLDHPARHLAKLFSLSYSVAELTNNEIAVQCQNDHMMPMNAKRSSSSSLGVAVALYTTRDWTSTILGRESCYEHTVDGGRRTLADLLQEHFLGVG